MTHLRHGLNALMERQHRKDLIPTQRPDPNEPEEELKHTDPTPHMRRNHTRKERSHDRDHGPEGRWPADSTLTPEGNPIDLEACRPNKRMVTVDAEQVPDEDGAYQMKQDELMWFPIVHLSIVDCSFTNGR
ncbi:hypothetical protein quinque_007908 [Culex quinquefasciatus]